MRNLYAEAAAEGKRLAESEGPLSDGQGGFMTEEERVLFWTARHAAREASGALLGKAKELGLSDDQWEALRAVAAEVAYD